MNRPASLKRTFIAGILLLNLVIAQPAQAALTSDQLLDKLTQLSAALKALQLLYAQQVKGVATVVVTNNAELTTAIQNATGGETIQLKPGNYPGLKLSNRSFASQVRITSFDPNNRANFSEEISLTSVSNLTFDGVDFLGATSNGGNADAVVYISGGSNLAFKNGSIVPNATLQGASNNKLWIGDMEFGFDNRNVNNFTLDNMLVSRADVAAVKFLNGQGLTMTNNTISDNRMDGFKFGGNPSDVIIKGNLIVNVMSSYYPQDGTTGATTEHSDAIQFINNVVATNVKIQDNVVLNMTGDPTQGFFNGGAHFNTIEVSNNYLQIGMGQAFTFSGVSNGLFHHNTVVPTTQAFLRQTSSWPDVKISGPSNVQIYQNVFALREWSLSQGVNGTTANNAFLVSDVSSNPAYYSKVLSMTGGIDSLTHTNLSPLATLKTVNTNIVPVGYGYQPTATVGRTTGGTTTPPPTPTDTDGDTIADTVDNCVSVANTNQANFDKDSQGDACDTDDDNDGIADTAEKAGCQFNASSSCGTTTTPAPTLTLSVTPTSVSNGGSATLTWVATDATACTASGAWTGTKSTSGSQSTGALSTAGTQTFSMTCTGAGGSVTKSTSASVSAVTTTPTDTDGDTIADTVDNCVSVANTNQANFDKDSQGDACDADDDNDGIADTAEKAGCQFNSSTSCGTTSSNLNYSLFKSSYLDGKNTLGTDSGMTRDVAFDSQGNFYVTGGTRAKDFPTTPGAYDETYNTGGQSTNTFGEMDVFLMKFSPTGALLWSTLIGGPNYDRAYAVEVGPNDEVFVAGRAGELYPTTAGTVQPNFLNNTSGGADHGAYGLQNGFVSKFTKTGTLVWSTYMTAGIVRDIDVDAQGNVHIAPTQSKMANPHLTGNAFQKTIAGGFDGMYVKMSADAKNILYGTYIGGSGDDGTGPAIRVDAAGNAYWNGTTKSTNFPTKNAFQGTYGGGGDVAVVKFAADGTLVYSSYVGGAANEATETHGMALDNAGNVYTAFTTGSNDITTKNGFDSTFGGGTVDGYVAKISPTGQLLAATYVGGTAGDTVQGITFNNKAQQVVLSGLTSSAGMTTTGAIDTTISAVDAYIAVLSADLSNKLYLTALGGSSDEDGRSIDVNESNGRIILGGQTKSTNYPTATAVDGSLNSTQAPMFTVIEPGNGSTAPADSDSDSVVDSIDNCITISNTNQANYDGDSQGDACDTDDDNDGILDTNEKTGCALNTSTTCGVTPPVTSNFGVGTRVKAKDIINVRSTNLATVISTQPLGSIGTVQSGSPVSSNGYVYIPVNFDTGVDGMVADVFLSLASTPPTPTDTDKDGVADTTDNCPAVANANQANYDGDSQGDACDSDDDNDGILDTAEKSGCQFNSSTSCGTDAGSGGGSGDGTTEAPTLTLTASPSTVAANDKAVITWSTTRAKKCTASGDWSGTKETRGSFRETFRTNETFTLTCTGTGGTITKSVTVTVKATGEEISGGESKPTTPDISTARVVATDNLYVRSTANGEKLGLQTKGSLGTKSGNVVTAGEHTWVYVNFDSAPDGFVAASYLSNVSSGIQPPKETAPTGDANQIKVQELLKRIAELQALLAALKNGR